MANIRSPRSWRWCFWVPSSCGVRLAISATVATHLTAPLLPPGDGFKIYPSLIKYRAMYLLNPAYRQMQDADYLRQNQKALAEARAAILFKDIQAPFDVFPFEFGLAYASGLELATRPAFQSYYATSRRMTEHNANFLASEKAPKSVLFSMIAVDNRYPALEDPQTQRGGVGAVDLHYVGGAFGVLLVACLVAENPYRHHGDVDGQPSQRHYPAEC